MKRTAFILMATVVLFPTAPARAANTLSVGATMSGDSATVSGSINYAITSFPILGTEAAGDDVLLGTAKRGGDLLGFSMQYEANGDLFLRWKTDPSPLGATDLAWPGPAGYAYGAAFIVDGVQAYEGVISKSVASSSMLFKCNGTNCAGATATSAVAGTLDPANGYLTLHIPASANIVHPGSVITPASSSVYIGTGYAYRVLGGSTPQGPKTWVEGVSDRLDQGWPGYTTGVRVELAVGNPGADPTSLSYTTRASVSGSMFTAIVPASAGQVVYARACGGADACLYASSGPVS